MSPEDHNKTHGIIYCLPGAGLIIGVIAVLLRKRPEDVLPLELIPVGLLLAAVLLLIPYGLFRRRRWARICVLILAALFVWLFPLGTILTIYTWWFMHSEGAKRLYNISSAES
jgi:drug/metabolite transporter (DMT)-like permease